MRLLGGQVPHDELLAGGGKVLNSRSLWGVQANVSGLWIPLIPTSSSFNVIETNRTGTFVVRTMQVNGGTYSGVLKIFYKALSSGPLKWDIEFSSSATASYRLVYVWSNLTGTASLKPAEKQLQVGYGSRNYTLAWNDVPSSLNTSTSMDLSGFSLMVLLGTVHAGASITVDPSLSTSPSPQATAYTYQRKIFYEPKAGYYFAFYFNGSSPVYRSSQFGLIWSSPQSIPGFPQFDFSAPDYFPYVFNNGRTVVVAGGGSWSESDYCNNGPCVYVARAPLHYTLGTINGPSISWSINDYADRVSRTCIASTASRCTFTVGIRNVSVGLDNKGNLVFSYNWYGDASDGHGLCTWGATSESIVFAIYNGQRLAASCEQNSSKSERSIIVTSNSGARVIYTIHASSGVQLASRSLSGSGAWLANVAPTGDTYTMTSSPNATTNYGTSPDLWFGSNPNSWTFTWMQFSLPTLPTGGQFSQAKLVLTFSPRSWRGYVATGPVYVSGAGGSWSETGLTWGNEPGTHEVYTYLSPNLYCGFGCTGNFTLDITPTIWGFYFGALVNNGVVLSMPFACCNENYVLSSREGAHPPQLQVHYNCCIGPQEIIDNNIVDSDGLSAGSDANLGIHVVYRGATNGNVTYAYLGPASASWKWTKDIFGQSIAFPTLTIDYSTNDVYAFGVGSSSASIIMKKKSPLGSWNDTTAVYPVTGRVNINELGSNAVTASLTNSSSIFLVWTEKSAAPYNVSYALIPIQTVWSPYNTPADPWNSLGIVPYGQYFANLGEEVSPSTGMLTMRQTDMSVPGRGLDLLITRVYTEPNSFLNNVPYNFESYSWAPIGDGWQLNFPWLSSVNYPTYIHLWDGEGYRIPSSFWTGFTSTFENHQGESFRLVRYVNGTIVLLDKSGTSYTFETSPNHALQYITDSTGNNTITLNYSNNMISCISDTVQRAFAFSYSGGLLQKITQVNGSCSNQGSQIRRVFYGNNGQSLTLVSDPGNRNTTYAYGPNPWLLSQITYPTSWYDTFSYTPYTLGKQATTYRVTLQQTSASQTSIIRKFAYSYTQGAGDQVISSTVTGYNGTQIAEITKYAFSFLVTVTNVTDSSGRLVRGDEQFFGVNGQIPKEVILVTDANGNIGNYTNYYGYDLWGNQIYSRTAVNSPSSYHENFNAWYNNGLPPGFYAFQDSFSRNQGTAPGNSWNVTGGYWMVVNGVYNGTETSGPQESMFSSATVGKTDISLQARVYVTRQVNTTSYVYGQRVGIFVHSTGVGTNKWALVLQQYPNGSKYLQMFDEWNSENVAVPFQWATGIWYTFNMTVHGLQATGWVASPGQNPLSLNLTFLSSGPAVSGTGFGLYAGGFSALFDDVQVATVSSSITGSSFSNSFVQNGAPGPMGLNTWLATTKPPSQGWNTTINWLPASQWDQAVASVNYGSGTWSTWFNQWTDLNAQWIWAGSNANVSASKDPVWFRRVFSLSSTTNLNFNITSDDTYTLYLDGTKLGSGSWYNGGNLVGSYPQSVGSGYHVLGIYATNPNGPDPAGLLVSVTNTGTRQVIFRSDATAGSAIGALAGSAQLQNGPGSLPEETYAGYTLAGSLNQTRQAYGGDVSPTNITIVAWPTTDCTCYSRSWGLTTDQPLPVPWWPQYQITVQNSNHTYTTSMTLATGQHYVEFGVSGFVPNYAWHAKIFVNGNFRAEGDVGRFNHLRAYLIVGTQWFTSSATYDMFGNPIILTDQQGNKTYFAYSPTYSSAYLTNRTQTLGATKITDLYTYDINLGTMLSSTDPKGNTTTYRYDQSGRLTQLSYVTRNANMIVNPGFETADFTGSTQTGMIIRANDQHSGQFSAAPTYNGNYPAFTLQQNFPRIAGTNITSIQFWYRYGDPYGHDTAQVLYSDGTSTQTTINIVSSWTLETLSFNSAKQIVGIKVSRSATSATNIYLDDFAVTSRNDFITYTYNDTANFVDVTNENGWQTRQIYDGIARPLTTERFSGGGFYSNETSAYNWMNLVTRQSDPLGNSTLYQYDVLGRLTNVTQPDNNVTTTSYNDRSSWVLSTDQYNNHNCRVYDRLGRLLSVIEYSDPNCSPQTLAGYTYVTNYGYDEAGNLVKMTTANGQSTTYSYDNLNRPVGISYPDGTFISYSYDPTGKLVKKVDQKNVATLYSYDNLGRLKTATYCGSPIISGSYTYDKDSNMLTFQNQNATISYNFDARNRILNETYAVNPSTRQVVDLGCAGSGGTSTVTGGAASTYTLSFTYNGETTNTIIYPGVTIQYMFDGLGRPVAAQQMGSFTDLAKLTYYGNDAIKGIQYGNGLLGNYTYDRLGRVSTIKLTNPSSGTTMMLLGYNYNKTGAVASVIGQVNQTTINEQYRYDPLLRLTNATVTSGGGATTIWYQYDNMGNRLVQSLNGTRTTFTYNSMNNELTGSSAPGTSTSYSYDPNGNLASKSVTTGGTVTWSHTWDANNHLLKVTNSTGQTQYSYDSTGRNLEAIESGSTWFYAYKGTNIMYKNLLSNNDKYAYVYIDGLRVSILINGTSQNYCHTDLLGSTRLMTYQDKTVIFTNNYLPFGQDNGRTTGSFASKAVDKFAGERASPSTGLYYYFQRWYDPSVGRFISQDPIRGQKSDPQTLNVYIYVVNSPLNGADPTGLSCIRALQDCFNTVGEFGLWLWGSTVGAGINSYNWYQTASPRDQLSFAEGIGAGIAVGAGIGALCVVTAGLGCVGIVALLAGVGAGFAGSYVAGQVYSGTGGRSTGGLEATRFWGGIGGGFGFGLGSWGTSAVWNRTLEPWAPSEEVNLGSGAPRFRTGTLNGHYFSDRAFGSLGEVEAEFGRASRSFSQNLWRMTVEFTPEIRGYVGPEVSSGAAQFLVESGSPRLLSKTFYSLAPAYIMPIGLAAGMFAAAIPQ